MIGIGTPRPAMKADGALLDDDLDAGGQGVGRGGQQVDAERLVGQGFDLPHLLADEVGRRAGHAQHAIAAGVRHGGGQRRVGDPAHAGQQDRVLDVQKIAKGRVQRHEPVPPVIFQEDGRPFSGLASLPRGQSRA
jgi:hypothetical protein